MSRGVKNLLLSRYTLHHLIASFTILISILMLVGWKLNISILTAPLENETVKANSALCFLFLGLAFLFLKSTYHYKKWVINLCLLIVLIVANVSLLQYIFNFNSGIDELIFQDPGHLPGTYPGRIPLTSSLNFILISVSLLFISFNVNKKSFVLVFCAFFPLTVSILASAGYLTGFTELANPAGFAKMAVHEAVTFIILCIGMHLTVIKEKISFNTEQKLFAGLTASATIIIFILLLSISGNNSVGRLTSLVEEAEHVRNQFDHIYEHLMDIESGDLIYLHSGDDRYLAIYKKGIDDLIPILDNLKKETRDNPNQQSLLETLDRLVRERIEFSKKRIESRKNRSEEEVLSLYPLAKGRGLVDRIRVVAEGMMAEQDNVIKSRNHVKSMQNLRNKFIIYSSLATELILLLFIFAVIARDVYGRRKAEEELRNFNEELEKKIKQRTEELLASNKELEAFSYSVSHDLRAPLRHIETFIRLLKSKISSSDDTIKHYMDIISNASTKLGQLIDDLLTYSKTGRTKLHLKEVDTRIIIEEVIVELSSQIFNRKINWQIGTLPTIYADQDLMKLVYQNLIDNAVKFTREIEDANIDLCSTEESDFFIFTVKDNGAGFDMTYYDRLFGVFQRLHSEEQFEGNGIGLANVYRIIKMHGGNVWAESKINEGTIISFSIPKKVHDK